MLLDDDHYKKVWEKVYHTFHFRPDVNVSVIPFTISQPYVVYDISEVDDRFDDKAITNSFIRCLNSEEKMYALDWHHSCFLFDPRDPEQMKSFYVEDSNYHGGGYQAYFPSYYPDGDYYFFIDEKFRFGYLSHPWRKEIWIFGDCLIAEFDKLYRQFGWKIKESFQSKGSQ